jgi:hypothetical protein
MLLPQHQSLTATFLAQLRQHRSLCRRPPPLRLSFAEQKTLHPTPCLLPQMHRPVRKPV